MRPSRRWVAADTDRVAIRIAPAATEEPDVTYFSNPYSGSPPSACSG